MRPHRRTRREKQAKQQPVSFSLGAMDFIQAGLARFDLRDPYYLTVTLSWRAFLLLFLAAELTINTTFALLYLLQPGCVANARPGAFTDVFFFSLETLATVGYGVMAPATTYGHVISALEIVTGLMFTAIMTGLLFVRFSKPKASILYAECPVVTTHNGRPTLMLRLGNARSNVMTNAKLSLHGLVRQTSAEGLNHRAIKELALERDHLPVFAILWTLMHVIDEDSPLRGLNAETVLDQDLRFFLTLSARDHATGQDVSDLRMYDGGDIRFGMRYTDAVQVGTDNRTIADYALIGAMEPDGIEPEGP